MDLLVRNYVRDLGLNYYTDQYGNIYVEKGSSHTYPCVVCHLDTVHQLESNLTMVEEKGQIYGMNMITKREAGIGADDKCGIYICLYLLTIIDNIKVVFFKDEEVGGIGSENCNTDFFKDVRFIIENDRRGNDDFIIASGGIELCSDEFIKDCLPLMNVYGYKPSKEGIFTDLNQLKNEVNVSMVNLSCGYYNAHSKSEFIILKELENCLLLNIDMITELEKVYHHKTDTTIRYYHNYSSKWVDNDDWFINDLVNNYCKDCFAEFDKNGKCPYCVPIEEIEFTEYLKKSKKKR